MKKFICLFFCFFIFFEVPSNAEIKVFKGFVVLEYMDEFKPENAKYKLLLFDEGKTKIEFYSLTKKRKEFIDANLNEAVIVIGEIKTDKKVKQDKLKINYIFTDDGESDFYQSIDSSTIYGIIGRGLQRVNDHYEMRIKSTNGKAEDSLVLQGINLENFVSGNEISENTKLIAIGKIKKEKGDFLTSLGKSMSNEIIEVYEMELKEIYKY